VITIPIWVQYQGKLDIETAGLIIGHLVIRKLPSPHVIRVVYVIVLRHDSSTYNEWPITERYADRQPITDE